MNIRASLLFFCFPIQSYNCLKALHCQLDSQWCAAHLPAAPDIAPLLCELFFFLAAAFLLVLTFHHFSRWDLCRKRSFQVTCLDTTFDVCIFSVRWPGNMLFLFTNAALHQYTGQCFSFVVLSCATNRSVELLPFLSEQPTSQWLLFQPATSICDLGSMWLVCVYQIDWNMLWVLAQTPTFRTNPASIQAEQAGLNYLLEKCWKKEREDKTLLCSIISTLWLRRKPRTQS